MTNRPSQPNDAQDFLHRSLNMRPGELPLALMSALFFFLVLCGYFFIRPVREAMGVSGGMGQLRLLFLSTAIVSLLLVVAFGGVVASTNRRRFIPAVYLFVIACLGIFATLLIVDVTTGGGLIGTDAETALSRGVGYIFYVWLSVVNLLMTSVFWAFMVDIFSPGQGKRMFPFIGVGGTLGAWVGASVAASISGSVESPYLPAGFMLVAATFFGLGVVVMLTLDKMARRSEMSRLGVSAEEASQPLLTPQRIGGSFSEGLSAVAKSPYLLGIGLWIVFMATSNTMIYFTQANLILSATDTLSQRVANFAQFDMWAQFATLITQIFITARLIKRLGVGWTLAILPLMTLAGFAVLAFWPMVGVMMIFQAVHRATRHAVSRPGRETLFSVVSPSEKYKAKPVIDVFLYRGGDLAGTGVESLFAFLGLAIAQVAMATVPIAGIWIALSTGLGAAQSRKATKVQGQPQIQ